MIYVAIFQLITHCSLCWERPFLLLPGLVDLEVTSIEDRRDHHTLISYFILHLQKVKQKFELTFLTVKYWNGNRTCMAQGYILSFPWTKLIFSNQLSGAAEHHTKYLSGPSQCDHAFPMTQSALNKTATVLSRKDISDTCCCFFSVFTASLLFCPYLKNLSFYGENKTNM